MKTSIIFATLTLALTFSVQKVSSAKILAISFFTTKSHKLTYFRLLEELASRGHEITIVSPLKPFKQVKGITEIYTFDIQEIKRFKEFNPFDKKESNEKINPFTMLEEFGYICRESYKLPQVKALLNQKFDLVFFQPMFNDCVLGLIHKLNAPVVLFFTTSAPTFFVNKLGGDHPPSFVGNIFLGYSDEMTFGQRFFNFGFTAMMEGILRFYYEPFMAQVYRDELGQQDLPSVREILGNSSLALSNAHFSLATPKPYLPDVIDVGGIHSRPAQPLPKDLEEFIQKGKDGFILFSMGSAMKGSLMSEEKRKMFLRVFSKLKQQVLWKWETETMPDLPKNVKLSKWLPQQDLLGHKNIKMFITHCGGLSTEEAIYHGTPLLGLPFFGDQDMNAKQAMNQGFLYKLEWNELTEEKLTKGINEVLNNPKYQDNVKRLSSIFRDQESDPLQRGVYWIEYVLRHKGAPHLRSASRKLNYFQYHSYDVIATYFAIILTVHYLLYAVLRWIVRKICGCFGSAAKVNVKKQKKTQ